MTSVGLLILFLAVTTIDAQNRCSDSRATCINIRECPPILEILRGPRPLAAETLATIKNSQCGFQGNDPLVCCVTEPMPTPTSINGTMEEPITVPDPPDVTNHRNLHLLDHQACGPLPGQKVFNGNKTGVFDYPWMALIQYESGREKKFRCGGTIITKQYVLTAAHCVTALPDDFRLTGVRVGDHDISKERDCEIDNEVEVQCAERYQDFGVDSFYYHPGYTTTRLQNDIALIRLNSTIDFRPFNVRTICMPFSNTRRLPNANLVVTGWGVTERGMRSPDLLQAKLPTMNNEQCRDVYKRLKQIWYKQICAGGRNNVDSCVGDSGGPLQAESMYNNNAARMVQYGIVSYGPEQCGIEGLPGVYTNVAYYMDWILDIIRE